MNKNLIAGQTKMNKNLIAGQTKMNKNLIAGQLVQAAREIVGGGKPRPVFGPVFRGAISGSAIGKMKRYYNDAVDAISSSEWSGDWQQQEYLDTLNAAWKKTASSYKPDVVLAISRIATTAHADGLRETSKDLADARTAMWKVIATQGTEDYADYLSDIIAARSGMSVVNVDSRIPKNPSWKGAGSLQLQYGSVNIRIENFLNLERAKMVEIIYEVNGEDGSFKPKSVKDALNILEEIKEYDQEPEY